MRTPEEIGAMRARLEDDIWDHGWQAEVDGASKALAWVLGREDSEAAVVRLMGQPEEERKREWVARGGNPEEWDTEEGA